MRGYLLPTVIALLLAAPLLWQIDGEVTMPNQVIGVAPVEAPATPAVAPPAEKEPGVRLLAVVPLAENGETTEVKAVIEAARKRGFDKAESRLLPVGFSPSDDAPARD